MALKTSKSRSKAGSKKSDALTALYRYCETRRNWIFDNSLVKKVTGESFGNQFDVTKLDHTKKLPETLCENDVFIVHLGGGKHQFCKGIRHAYRSLEPILKKEIVTWPYKRSVLNGLDQSEAGVLSLAYNQFIVQDFLYDDITVMPKIHLPRRTQTSFSYSIGKQ